MVKVKLIKRKLPSGNITLMLEYYGNGSRTFESLEMVLTKSNKREHSDLLAMAKKIANRKQTEYYEKKHQIVITDTGTKDFIAFFKSLLPDYRASNKRVAYNHFIAWKPECLMNEVDFNLLEGFVSYLNGKANLSVSSKSVYVRAVCSVVGKAYDRELIAKNPLKIFKTKNYLKPLKAERIYMSKEEIQKLEDTPCTVDVIKRGYLFGSYVGLRHGDIRQLEWSSIKKNMLHIRMEKTGRLIKIKLINRALALLPKDKSKRPFEGLNKADSLQNLHLKVWMIEAGVWKSGATFHSSRHSFAVNSLLAGVDVFTLRDLMGHTSVVTTEVYARIVDSMTSDASDKLNDYWGD